MQPEPIAFDSRQDCVSSTEVFGALGSSSPQAQAICITGPVPIQNATRGKSQNGLGIGAPGDPMYTLDQASQHAVCLPFDTTQMTSAANRSNPQYGDPCPPLAAGAHAPAIATAYGFQPRIARNGRGDMGDVVCALTAQAGETGKGDAAPHVAIPPMQVRRLTPRECERLQGFWDDYTLVTVRGKPAADGPRYKALGNSMAVPVMAWIGRQIDFAMLFDVTPSADDLFA